MRTLIIALLGLVSVLDAPAQPEPNSLGETNAPEHATNGAARDAKHQLEPGDVISYQVLEEKKAPVSLVVTDSGEMHVPILGRLEVAGKTCRELAAELKTLLEKDYFKRATVEIGLDSMNKGQKATKVLGHFLIWGEVHNQGSFDILAGQTMMLTDALLRAGGVNENADKKKIKIIRNDGHGSTRTIEVNIAEIMEKGKTTKDVPIEPNDYIIVTPRLIRF